MSELAVSLLRLSYLLLVWIFVVSAIGVLRRDLYGTGMRAVSRRSSRRQRASDGVTPQPAAPPRQAPTPTGPTRLVITAGPLAGTSLPLGSGPIVIGRSPDSTLVIDDEFASSRHAQLFPNGPTWYVEDIGSRNGTFLDRDRVTGPVAVRPGEPIRIGRTVLELQR